MTEIKKGDWVYRTGLGSDGITEAVFKCVGLNKFGNPLDDSGWHYSKEVCHRLTTLEPLENVERGTRCAVIGKHHIFSAGDIVEWDDVSLDQAPFVRNEINGRTAVQRSWLARLPDCAQRAPGAPDPDEEIPNLEQDIDNFYSSMSEAFGIPKYALNGEGSPATEHPTPLPCPHPEWEGVWLFDNGLSKTSHKLEWVDSHWELDGCEVEWHENKGYNFGWTLLEPAPAASTAGPKLPRPRKHGGVTVPWDPYGEG
jgi:hypothetical protein